jgi:hypothetical protein
VFELAATDGEPLNGGGCIVTGVLLFKGMQVGVLPGDFTITVDESGAFKANFILATAYNVLPLWLRIAHDELNQARIASDAVGSKWGINADENCELLIAELEPSLQVFVSCGIALDALYDQLRPFANLSDQDSKAWKTNRTARESQIVEVIRRVFKLNPQMTAAFRKNISQIFEFRNRGVHPSLELKRPCTRPDVPGGVDWKFSAYKYANARICFEQTMYMIIHLYERKSENGDVNNLLENVVHTLEQLKVIHRTGEPGQPSI